MTRYSEAAWRPIPGASTSTYLPDTDGGAVGILHTTEGDTIPGAEAAYRAKGVVPHFTADLGKPHPSIAGLPVFAQHVDTARSASAVRNEPGGVETNRQGVVIQLELIGHAEAAELRPDAELRRLGFLLRLIGGRERIPQRWPSFVAYPASAGEAARQRMGARTWAGFSGWCGHQHVPENVHGDPGALNLARAFQLSAPPTPTPDPTPTVEEGETMFLAQQLGHDPVYLVEPGRLTHVTNPDDLAAVSAALGGHPVARLSDATWKLLTINRRIID